MGELVYARSGDIMAVATAAVAPHRLSKRVEKELNQSKVAIRRLPPDFTEEKLMDTIAPLPPHNYFYFAPGDPTFGLHGCARAYINFTDESLIVPFRDQLDGLVLESDKGQKYRIVVEFAPYQGLPRRAKRRKDVRCATIEQDADYCAFLEAHTTQTEPQSALNYSSYLEELEATKVTGVVVTPLVEYLKAKRDKRKPKAKVYVVEKKKKRGEVGGKSKPGKSSGGDKEERESSPFAKGAKEQKYDRPSRGKVERKPGDGGTKASETSAKVVKRERDVRDKPHTSYDRETSRPHTKKKGWGEDAQVRRGGRERDDRSGYFESKSKSWSTSRREQESFPYSDQKPSASGERREDSRDKSRGRNRDKPDRAIYVPRVREPEQDRRSGPKDEDWARDGEARSTSSRSKKGSSYDRYEGRPPRGRGQGASRYYSSSGGDDYAKRDQRGGEQDRGRGGRGGGRRGGRGRGRGQYNDTESSRAE